MYKIKKIKVLGIESSCDETAVSVVEAEIKGEDVISVKVLSDVVVSQINIHKEYGGVVPEVAAREHVLKILPIINKALIEVGIKKAEVKEKIDSIAVTKGPGLVTSLLAGVETAKTLSFVWDIPLVAVNHIEGHIYANFINQYSISSIQYPIIILTVSGGHTMLILSKKQGQYETIGETRDDAAGEAFDKVAKMMDVGYPGGPIISKLASEFKGEKKVVLPRPMLKSADYDFSFSGLKTAIRYELRNDKNWKKRIHEYAYEFEQAVVEVLVAKTIKAAKKNNVKTVMLAGGVSANKVLREELEKKVRQENIAFLVPDLKFTTDNATMIASAGVFKTVKKEFINWKDLQVDCGLEL